ncbi:MAG: hypothetical protein ACRECW_06195, partial [Phyllobacterium sp.]
VSPIPRTNLARLYPAQAHQTHRVLAAMQRNRQPETMRDPTRQVVERVLAHTIRWKTSEPE